MDELSPELNTPPPVAATEEPKPLSVLDSLNSGMSSDELEQQLATQENGDISTARSRISTELSPIVSDLLSSGEFTEEEVRGYLDSEYKLSPELTDVLFQGTPEEDVIEVPELVPVSQELDLPDETISDLRASLQNVYQRYIPMFMEPGARFLGNEELAKSYQKDNIKITTQIANSLRSLGRNVEIGIDEEGNVEIFEILPTGMPVEIDESFWQSLGNEKLEIAGGIAGGYGGHKLGKAIKIGGKGLSQFGWPGKLAQLSLTLAGGALGTSAGRGLDVAYSAWHTKQNLDAAQYADAMKDAGVFAGTLEIVGAPIIKGGTKLTIQLGRAYKHFALGNKNGAYKALKDTLHLDDNQVDEIIKEWETVTGEKAQGLLRETKAMHVLPQTEPGAEAIVSKAAGRSPKASTEVARSISARAKDLNAASKTLTSDNVATVINDDLGKYVKDVKDYYTGVKQFAIDGMEESTYRFNYDKLAVEPLLDSIKKKINNPNVLERFERMVMKVRDLGGVPGVKKSDSPLILPKDLEFERTVGKPSELRQFSDLLELRRTLDGFKYNSKIQSALDFKAINKVIKGIDDEIARTAKKEMDNGATWLKEWGKANTEYSKMLQLNENVLYKALTAKGVDHKKVIRGLSSKITSIDGTFMKVVSKLPPATRAKAEGAVLDTLVQKHTQGFESGLQATHFTNLADDLKHVSFSTKDARDLKRTISMLAKVFKNDQALANATGRISKTGFNTSLTANPVEKAHYEFATHMFDYLRRLTPTEKADYLALEMHTAKLLKDPKNSKAIEALKKLLPDDPELESVLHRLAIETTKFGSKDKYPKVQVFRTGLPGEAHKARDGKLGKGIYWSTSEKAAKNRSAVTGAKVFREDILPTRVATLADIHNIYGTEDITADMLQDPTLATKLKEQGYDGLSIDEEIVIFKE